MESASIMERASAGAFNYISNTSNQQSVLILPQRRKPLRARTLDSLPLQRLTPLTSGYTEQTGACSTYKYLTIILAFQLLLAGIYTHHCSRLCNANPGCGDNEASSGLWMTCGVSNSRLLCTFNVLPLSLPATPSRLGPARCIYTLPSSLPFSYYWLVYKHTSLL